MKKVKDMKNIELAIGNNKYSIQCEEKDEDKFIKIGNSLNKIVNVLAIRIGRTHPSVLMFVCAMILALQVRIKEGNKSSDIIDTMIKSVQTIVRHMYPKEINDQNALVRICIIFCDRLDNSELSSTSASLLKEVEQNDTHSEIDQQIDDITSNIEESNNSIKTMIDLIKVQLTKM